MEARSAALDRARDRATAWLATLDDRAVPPLVDADEMVRRLGDLPDEPTPAADVVDLLAEACEPGLVGIPSGRFFGMVIGGTLPAALGADWPTSAWDQNVGLRALTPAGAAVEEVAERWLLELLGLPAGSAVGFVTGATMANFTCLAAARDTVLRRAGYDVQSGLAGPRFTCSVAAALLADGTTWMSGSRRHDRANVRISVSNWSTTDDDVRRSVEALALAAAL